MIFVNSMSDLFHEAVPLSFIERVFEVMVAAERHVFQILTKRHERLAALAPRLEWPSRVWMGVSIENRRWLERADYLRRGMLAHSGLVSEDRIKRSLGLVPGGEELDYPRD